MKQIRNNFIVRVQFNTGTIRRFVCTKLPRYTIDDITGMVLITLYTVEIDKNLKKFEYEFSISAQLHKITYVGRIQR